VRDLIVVGTDGSEHAAAAVEAAGALAAVWEAAVDVVGVHRFLQPEHPESHRQSGRPPRPCGQVACPCTLTCRRGDAALVIAGVAAEENARLIVVGAGGAASSPAGSSGRRRPGRRARDLQCADRPPARAGLSARSSTVSSRGRPSAERWRTGAIPTVGRDVAH
jgi:nucleotide-binding universal stress UspA family protein